MDDQRVDSSPALTVFNIQLPADSSSSSSSLYLSTLTESQITLVGDPIDIFFSEWDIFNTTIHVDGTPRYSFSTISNGLDAMKRTTAVTEVQSGVELGKIRRSWMPGLHGKVEYRDGKEVEVKNWIRKLKQTSAEGLSQWAVTISGHGELIWRKDRKRRLVLSREDEPEKALAWLKTRSPTREPGAFSLRLSREMESSLYEIMISFMFVEKRVRSDERTMDMIWRMSAGF